MIYRTCFRRLNLLLAITALLFPGPWKCHAELSPGYPLGGELRFKSGDHPGWAAPDLDDSDWSMNGISGSFRGQGFSPRDNLGWYRMKFKLPLGFHAETAGIFLGEIGNADETYLNGELIGATGKIGNRFVESRAERLYKIPASLLSSTGVNCLAIRVLSLEPASGLLTTRPVLGDYNTLLIEGYQRDQYRIMEESGFITLVLIFFVSCCLFYVAGSREKEFISFAGFALIYLFSLVFDSTIFYELDLKTAGIESVQIASLVLIPICLLLFQIHFSGHHMTRVMKATIGASFLFFLVTLFFGNLNYGVYKVLGNLWLIQVLVSSVIAMYLNYYMVRRKTPEYPPLLLGTGGLIIFGLMVFISSLDLRFSSRFYFLLLQWDDYLVIFFMICLLYALGLRFSRLKQERRALSGKILQAHEDERKRLAMELHDGLGQSMLAVKFRLQHLHREFDDSRTKEMVEEVSGGIEELRRISHGLRPMVLDKAGLVPAIHSHISRLTPTTTAHITSDMEEIGRLPSQVESNLFRIFQEALSNGLKHAGAACIHISLRQKGTLLEMEIRDNGVGVTAGGSGMGLSTMRERAGLLNGEFVIISARNKGTRIRVRVNKEG